MKGTNGFSVWFSSAFSNFPVPKLNLSQELTYFIYFYIYETEKIDKIDKVLLKLLFIIEGSFQKSTNQLISSINF